jgi:thiamine-phosphate diphosphorylase / hydroxyethylthiazole kinase
LRTLYGTVSLTGRAFDGIAVVSDIVTSREPRMASSALAEIVRAFKATHAAQVMLATEARSYARENILNSVGIILENVRKLGPLVHQVYLDLVARHSVELERRCLRLNR